MRALLITLSFFIVSSQLFGFGPNKTCGTMDGYAERIQNNPELLDEINEREAKLQAYINKAKAENRKLGAGDIVTIPVVFHVIWNVEAENISEEQIQSQLDVLNEDFSGNNPNIGETLPQFQNLVTDMEIEFCLAQQDPNGLPTSGITRTYTDSLFFSRAGTNSNQPVKFTALGGKDAWPNDQYLNFWVCDLDPELLGYAQFPPSFGTGGFSSPDTDGVVCDYQYTGREGPIISLNSSSLGSTATHEVGHWIGLRHIWGDGACAVDDFVLDTPNSDDSNFGCLMSHVSCNSLDMVQNFMDYSDDDCTLMFTHGQKDRMSVIFEPGGDRASLVNSIGCQPSQVENLDAQLIEILSPVPFSNSCEEEITPSIQVRNYGFETITELVIRVRVDGNLELIHEWDGTLVTGDYVEIEMDAIDVEPGSHDVSITLHEINGGDDDFIDDNSTEVTIQIKGGELPVEEGFEEVAFPPAFFEVDNPDINKTWTLTNDVSHSGAQSMYIRCYNYGNQSTYDDLILPTIDMTNYDGPILEFYSAYARYDSEDSDTLEVLVSGDCGESFDSVYKRSGALLASAGNTTSEFFPTESEWKDNSIDLSDYIGNPTVIVKIRCINSFENNLYIDDINLRNESPPVGIEELELTEKVNLYPNPATNSFNVLFDSQLNEDITISVKDVSGKLLINQVYSNENGTNQISINASSLPAGIYFVNTTSNTIDETKKLIIID